IKMAVLARKLGKHVIPVVEKFTELETIVRYASELNVRPVLGVRVKLAAKGAGRWKYSAGFRSKFGLTLTETLEAFEYLKNRDLADCLQLVHFHLGSQITNIRSIKSALTEATRVYVELHRVGAGVKCLDVGGGLGIDYDGSQTDFESSTNYTLQEYANDVVFRIKGVCDEAGVPHPTIISESGRAVVAYHSVLVFDVLGTSNFDQCTAPDELPPDAPQPIQDLFANFRDFQSMPDSWAIDQLFPIMPIHRLGEAPTRRAVLGDITCDSDGKIDQFIDLRDVRTALELHPYDGSEPYYLGGFLLGAYQE